VLLRFILIFAEWNNEPKDRICEQGETQKTQTRNLGRSNFNDSDAILS
jgi:hypothetical protein